MQMNIFKYSRQVGVCIALGHCVHMTGELQEAPGAVWCNAVARQNRSGDVGGKGKGTPVAFIADS